MSCKAQSYNKLSIVKTYEQGIIWLKIDKCFFHLERDYFCCLAYIPPENSMIHRYAEILIAALEKKKTMCCLRIVFSQTMRPIPARAKRGPP